MAYNYEYPYFGDATYNNDWLINKFKEIEAKVADLDTLVGTFDTRITKNSADIASLQMEFGVIKNEFSQLESLVNTFDGRITDNTNDISVIKSDIATINGHINSIDSDIISLKERLNAAETNIQTNTTDINTNATGINTNATAIASLQTKTAALETSLSNLSGDLSEIEPRVSGLESSVQTLQTAQTVVDGEIQALQTGQTNINTEITSLDTRVTALEQGGVGGGTAGDIEDISLYGVYLSVTLATNYSANTIHDAGVNETTTIYTLPEGWEFMTHIDNNTNVHASYIVTGINVSNGASPKLVVFACYNIEVTSPTTLIGTARIYSHSNLQAGTEVHIRIPILIRKRRSAQSSADT